MLVVFNLNRVCVFVFEFISLLAFHLTDNNTPRTKIKIKKQKPSDYKKFFYCYYFLLFSFHIPNLKAKKCSVGENKGTHL